MRVARGRARFEARDPPASRLLECSPLVGRHLRSEGRDVSVAELRNRDGKRKLCVHPPIFAVPSQRNAHRFQSSSLSEQADNGESFRPLSEPRRQRGRADPGRSGRFAVPPACLGLPAKDPTPAAAWTTAGLPAGRPPCARELLGRFYWYQTPSYSRPSVFG